VDRNATILLLHQFLYYGQSHSTAFHFVTSLQRLEQLKDFLVKLGQYAGTVIAHKEFHEISDLLSRENHLATLLIVMLNCVVDEIS
jgi:hypothetical protein